jgi:acyl carrier protein
MGDPDVEAVLIARLADGRGSTAEEVRLGLQCAGAIDSLEGVELAMEAEQAFGIAISDSELSSNVCRSVPELVALVRSKLG